MQVPVHTFWLSWLVLTCLATYSGFTFGAVSDNIATTEPLANRAINANYPASNLRDNLLSLAQDIELSIFFSEESVDGLTVDGVTNELTVRELLTLWLTPHCLEAEFIRSRFVVISPTEGCGLPPEIANIQQAPVNPYPEAPPAVMEEMLVQERAHTGSRLRQAELTRAMPIDVIDQQEIQLSGFQSISELLRYVPAVSGNSTSTLISNGGDGSANITLRGLPASNTLVLLNGRRTNYNALTGDAVNLNTLPLSMVERIEILKDGVSAIYGADAVAGVVNIITKRDLAGFKVDVYHGLAAQGDLETSQLSIQSGFLKTHWHGSLNLSAYRQNGIFSRDRVRSESSDDRPRGGIDKRSSATAPARITTPQDQLLRLAPGADGTQLADYAPASSEDRFEYRDFTSSIVPLDRYSLYTSLGYEAGPWSFNTDGFVSYTKADTYFAPLPLFTGFETIPLPLAGDHPLNPFGTTLTDVRRRVVELPERRQKNETTSYQLIVEGKYQSERTAITSALQFDRTQAEERRLNGLRADRLALALSADCVAPCVPFNLLGPVGSITPQMLQFVGAEARVTGESTLSAFTLDFDWHPQESDIAVAAGIEARRERLDVDPDAILQQGLFVAGGNRGETRGKRSILEAYGELYLPLIKRKDRHALALQLATRISNYTDFGSVSNPRIVMNWQPNEAWDIRLSWGKGFRAPTLPQLRRSNLQSFQQLNDPCSVVNSELVGCLQQSDPTLNQFLTITGGNSGLNPERSTTMTLGSGWSHHGNGVRTLVNVDLFSIAQEDVVDSSAQFIVNRNAQDGSFAGRIERDDNGNLTRVLATLQNIGSRDVRGLDVASSIEFERPGGRYIIALNATHIHSFEDKFDPGSPTIDKAGTFTDEASQGLGSLPDWKLSLAATAQLEHWQAHYSIYWISSLTEKVPLSDRTRRIEDWMTHNLNVSYFGPATGWIRATLGIQNVFDEAPPFSAAAFNDSYDGRTYDITGRYFFLKLDKSL